MAPCRLSEVLLYTHTQTHTHTHTHTHTKDASASEGKLKGGEYALLTMIVTSHHVSFWENLVEVATVPLSRPLTDCNNNGEGLLLGSAGQR